MMSLFDVEQSQNILRWFAERGQNIDGFGREIATFLGAIAATYAPAIVQYGFPARFIL